MASKLKTTHPHHQVVLNLAQLQLHTDLHKLFPHKFTDPHKAPHKPIELPLHKLLLNHTEALQTEITWNWTPDQSSHIELRHPLKHYDNCSQLPIPLPLLPLLFLTAFPLTLHRVCRLPLCRVVGVHRYPTLLPNPLSKLIDPHRDRCQPRHTLNHHNPLCEHTPDWLQLLDLKRRLGDPPWSTLRSSVIILELRGKHMETWTHWTIFLSKRSNCHLNRSKFKRIH